MTGVMRLLVLLSLLLHSALLFAAEPVILSDILVNSSGTHSQLTFVLSRQTFGKIKYFPYPPRVEVLFANTYKHGKLQNKLVDDANLKSIVIHDDNKGLLRVIISVKGKASWQSHFISSLNEAGAQLQLDLVTKHTESTSNLQQYFSHSMTNALAMMEVELARHSQDQHKVMMKPDIFTVVIDAGHGGKDTGALGVNGAREKNVTLSIARKLAQEINLQPNMRAVLTRHGDYFVPLRQRLKLARKDKADVFIAIHADAYFDNSVTGASIYALSQRGASSEAARWLAQRENFSALGEIELNALQDRDPVLRSVMVDLAQTATIQDSIRLGNKVLDALDDISSMHYQHVERAPFVVLKSPDIPSILVETGYITNPREERRLVSSAYQQQLAQALCRGIVQYRQQL